MACDKKNRNHIDEGEMPKKKEYLLLMELQKHCCEWAWSQYFCQVELFVLHSSCSLQRSRRYHLEQLWYQYYHWSDALLGIDWSHTNLICVVGLQEAKLLAVKQGKKDMNSNM